MTTNIWIGNSVGSLKTVQVTPGPNITQLVPPPVFTLGLGSITFTFSGWDPNVIVAVWSASNNDAVAAITATVSGQSVIFTANNPGDDFEITCDIPGGQVNSSSCFQTLTLLPAPTGGTFTVTVAGQTTGNITFSSTASTFASNIATAIAALSGFTSNDVIVIALPSPEAFLFDFSHGQFLGLDVAPITCTHTSLTGGNATVSVSVVQVGAVSTSLVAGTNAVSVLSFPIAGTHTATVNTIQTLSSTMTLGKFTLSVSGYGTTVPIDFTGTRKDIQTALEGILGKGTVSISGGPLVFPTTGVNTPIVVEFIGVFAGTSVAAMTVAVCAGQTITSLAHTGGFTATFSGYGTTATIAYNASAASIQAAMEPLFGVGNVVVTGTSLDLGTISVIFIGSLIGVSVPAMSISLSGVAQDEIQQLLLTGFPTAGTFTLTYSGQTTGAIAYNASATTIQTAVRALSNVGSGQATCTGGPLVAYGSPVVTTPLATTKIARTITVPSTFSVVATTGGYDPQSILGYPSNITFGILSSRYTEMLCPFPVSGRVTNFVFSVSSPYPLRFADAFGQTMYPFYAALAFGASSYSSFNDYTSRTSGTTKSQATDFSVATSTDSFGNTQYTYSYDFTTAVQAMQLDARWTGIVEVRLGQTAVAGRFNDNWVIDSNGIDPRYVLTVDHVYNYQVAGNHVGSAYAPSVALTTVAATIVPVNIEFTGTLANTNVAQITATPTLTGGGISTFTIQDGVPTTGAITAAATTIGTVTETTTRAGGSVSVENIDGGTFSLNIAGTVVPNIPFNVTATSLVTAINTVFGATVVSATGGPAPDSTITLTFINTLGQQPVVINFLSALHTNVAGSITQKTLQTGLAPSVPTNVWNVAVVPGSGTLGLLATALLKVTLKNTTFIAASGVAGIAEIPLTVLTPITLQAAINEILASDACRVTLTSHSVEYAKYAQTTGANFNEFWYMSDVYQVVFNPDWPGISIQVSLLGTSPVTVGDALDAGDTTDSFPEIKRVGNGLTNLNLITTSAIKVDLTAVSPPLNTVSWRYKLLPQYNTGNVNHSGKAGPLSGTIHFEWSKFKIDEVGLFSTPLPALVVSASIDWSSSAATIQTTLENMFFGKGNVLVEGGLRYSWLSESDTQSPPPRIYSDLRVTLIGVYQGMQLDDFGYTLICVLTDQVFSDPTSYQKDYLMWGDFYTKTVGPHQNRRESISVGSPQQCSSLQIGACKYLATVSPGATRQTIQDALNSLFSVWVASTKILATATAVEIDLLPLRFTQPITVHGTSFLDGPMEFEFTGGGAQNNALVALIMNAVPAGITIGLITKSTLGVLATPAKAAVDALQLVSIIGNPFSGTFTLTWGGHTTSALPFDVSLAALQSAVTTANFASPTITGDVINGFTFDWAGAGGPRATITTTPSLNNAGKDATVIITHLGGQGSTFVVNEIVPGDGPSFADAGSNWSLGRVPNSHDDLLVEDSPSPILYGIDMSSGFVIQKLNAGAPTLFALTRNRKVFQNKQVVTFTGTGTAPTGMTFGTDYIVVNPGAINAATFTLSDTSGNMISCSAPGNGVFTLSVQAVTLKVYNRFTAEQIGLPYLRDGAVVEYLPRYWRAGWSSIQIGLDAGGGLTLGSFDSMDYAAVIEIDSTGRSSVDSIPSVLLKTNNAAASLLIRDGSVGLSMYSGETSNIGNVIVDNGSFSAANATISGKLVVAAAVTKLSLLNTTVSQAITIG